MIKELIAESKAKFAEDYKEDPHLDDELMAFEEGMISAFRMMLDLSLHGSITFDLVVEGK